jgi:hypothetical protein
VRQSQAPGDASGGLFGLGGGESPSLPAPPLSEGAAHGSFPSVAGGVEPGKNNSAPSLFATPVASTNDAALKVGSPV